jgi:hypothetical protein
MNEITDRSESRPTLKMVGTFLRNVRLRLMECCQSSKSKSLLNELP